MNQPYQFLSGGIMMGCVIAAMFFFRSKKKTGDRFFGLFGVAFTIFALERVLLMFYRAERSESYPQIYLVRLLGFALILYAIYDKNRQGRRNIS